MFHLVSFCFIVKTNDALGENICNGKMKDDLDKDLRGKTLAILILNNQQEICSTFPTKQQWPESNNLRY